MASRFGGFSSSEKMTLELALNELGDYFGGLMYKYPKCPDFAYWRERTERITALQKEILADWAEKSRSA